MSKTTAGSMAKIDSGNRPRADDVSQMVGERLADRPRTVSAGHGWSWFVDGYRLVSRNLAIWVLVTIVAFAISILIGIIPVVSLVLYALWPVFVGGLMLGCQTQDTGGDMTVGHLFAGFQQRAGKLFALGGLYLATMLAIALVGVMFVFGTGMLGYSAASGQTGGFGAPMIAIFVLFALALLLPLITLFWFAPALVALHDVGVFEAMKLSFVGCWRNILPFFIYSVIGLLLTIVAIIPVGLGLLVLSPVFWGGMYVGHKEIFLQLADA
jgi:uncharacterized membrane protein